MTPDEERAHCDRVLNEIAQHLGYSSQGYRPDSDCLDKRERDSLINILLRERQSARNEERRRCLKLAANAGEFALANAINVGLQP